MKANHMAKSLNHDEPLKPRPQPKWAVLQVLNFVVIGVFSGSIIFCALNFNPRHTLDPNSSSSMSNSPLTNMFFPLMILWSCCLAYFFGFFGISFLDKESLKASPSSYGLDEMARDAQLSLPEPIVDNAKSSAAKKLLPAQLHNPPICSDANPSNPLTGAEVDGVEPDYAVMEDEDILASLVRGELKDHQLEKKLGDYERAVRLRRGLFEHILEKPLDLIPYEHFDYKKVFGANCEIVLGYVPIPLGIVGPLVINGEPIHIPMATTEGCLVASTNRGCKAITAGGGCCSVVMKDAITRAPCVRMPSAMRAAAVKRWLGEAQNYKLVEEAFNSTTSYGRLESVEATIAGRNVYLRFSCMSGDAMGMNMVSKGCLKAIEVLEAEFPDMVLVAISGNMCTDKKPAAINWILGRGKSIVVEAVIPDKIVKSVLKSSVHDMIETNKQKNHIGSAMAGSIGGFNAHAANIVTAVFLATGQDPAQNVESSNCLTIMEYADDGKSLHVSVTMPSVEVGTVGGGTHLPAQAGCLDICGVRGAAKGAGAHPGDNSRKLAQIVGGAVLAGELSLMAALAANHLVRSHMQHNRKPAADEAAPSSAAGSTAGGVPLRKNSSMPDLST
eukprot:gene33397-43174_t